MADGDIRLFSSVLPKQHIKKGIKRRGYRHCSPVDEKYKSSEKLETFDRERSLEEMLKRCPRCKRRHSENKDNCQR